ncbi:MAG TPA: hypothetical protein VNA20_00105 [Frankiaceae bacterium]|nr:hypothetical protein [Frankiaceae bacterium]
MVPQGRRVVAMVLAAVVVVLALWTPVRNAPAAAPCATQCAHLAVAADEPPCLSDPACAGRGQGAAAYAELAAPAPLAVVVAALLLATVPRRRSRPASTGLLPAGGLYRPPQISV